MVESGRAGTWQDASLHLLQDPTAQSLSGFDLTTCLSLSSKRSVLAGTHVILTPGGALSCLGRHSCHFAGRELI